MKEQSFIASVISYEVHDLGIIYHSFRDHCKVSIKVRLLQYQTTSLFQHQLVQTINWRGFQTVLKQYFVEYNS